MSVRTMSVAIVCGAVAVACAGADTPARDDDLENAIAQAYANGSGPGPAAGSGGRAPAGGSGGGASQGGSNATSGAGGSPAGGSTAEGGAGGSGSEECNGAAILVAKCNGPACHGDGSGFSGFAASEDIALTFIDRDPSSTGQCADDDPIITAGSPANSLIVQKLDGSMPCGQPMPLGPPLSADEIQCIEDWIGTLE